MHDETGSEEVIHILNRKSALCGLKGNPCEWPPGNMFVGQDEAELVTCPDCIKKNATREASPDP